MSNVQAQWQPPSQSVNLDEDWVEIGKITAPQGLRGELRVYPESDFPARFLDPGDRWLLRPGAQQPEVVQLTKGRLIEGKGLYVIQIAGVTDRDQAEQLRGAKLLVPVGDRPPLEEGEFHLMDLVGLRVIHAETEALIGTVVGLVAAGNDLLEIQRPDQPDKTILIPLVKEFVTQVDIAGGQLWLRPIPGLLPD